eukprot:361347-Chlamydomonas_euryale.AAC.2
MARCSSDGIAGVLDRYAAWPRQEARGKRQEARGKRQEARGKRQNTRDERRGRRNEAGGRRQEAGGRRKQETRDKRQEARQGQATNMQRTTLVDSSRDRSGNFTSGLIAGGPAKSKANLSTDQLPDCLADQPAKRLADDPQPADGLVRLPHTPTNPNLMMDSRRKSRLEYTYSASVAANTKRSSPAGRAAMTCAAQTAGDACAQ